MLKHTQTNYDEHNNVISSKQTIIKKVTADEFIQVYLENLEGLLIPSTTKGELVVLMWLWKYSDYRNEQENEIGNSIILNPKLFYNINLVSGISEPTCRNIISSLKRKGYIIADKQFRGVYYLNPNFFFKGRLSDKMESCELLIRYEIGDKDTSPNSDIKPNVEF